VSDIFDSIDDFVTSLRSHSYIFCRLR